MPAISKETREYYKSRVRAVLVVDPQASLREIQQTLGKSQHAPISLSISYLSSIVKKIQGERAHRNDAANISLRISFLQDKIKRIDGQLWAIAADKGAKDIAKVQALKALAENELKLLSAEMDAGIFDRKVGTLKVEERRVSLISILTNAKPDERNSLINALKGALHGNGNQADALPAGSALPDRAGSLPAHTESQQPQLEAGQAA